MNAGPEARATWQRYRRALRDEALPCAFVDLDALEHNARVMLAALPSPGPTLRLASKSLRCPALLRRLLALDPRLQGLLTMSAAETARLHALGFHDLFLAYPPGRPAEAAALAEVAAGGARLLVTVDDPAQVELLDAAAQARSTVLALAIDLDLSLRVAGQHLGVRRSPIQDAPGALALATLIRSRPHLRLDGLLAYEAQVAGIPDRSRHGRALDPIRALIKARSIPLARQRRRAALQAIGPLAVVNGGGTGSLHSTGQDPSVTEVTAGSGFLCPHLFDGYAGLDLRPAAFFALAVTRRPAPGILTCQGGGFPASGPPGPDRAPLPWLPAGLAPLSFEGFGEVQTPLDSRSCAEELSIGDPVICRHAKAGELLEHVDELLFVRGDEIVGRAPTLRGLGARPPAPA